MSARSRTAAGFTLLELMIAMTLGLVLSVVIAQLFANTRQANRATEDAARVQESVRFAIDVIGRTVRIAGYMSNPNAVATTVFPSAARALDGVAGVGTVSDKLIVRFQGGGTATLNPDSTILDCQGAAVAADFTGTTVRTNTFFIQPSTVDGRNALWCSTDATGNPSLELAPGVEAMKVIFGEDTTPAPPNGDGTADRFVSLGSVTSLDNVVAVRVYLLFSGKELIRLDTASATYTLAGTAYTYTDQKIRRVVTTTITLRNRAP
jgi:type IV pilus assembly protein PilW